MIDFHNHILPNTDDGPKSISESIDMLRYASEQGITKVINTVHYQHPKMDNKVITETILHQKLDLLNNKLKKNKIDIKIYLASEVFYLPNLTEIANIPFITTMNKKYMLIEFSSLIFPENFENEFFKLQNLGITPIIAHPERYRYVKNDISLLRRWLDLGYVLQIDAGSLIGNFGKNVKKISFDIIEKHGIHLIGSDAHNNKKRNFCLKEAYDALESKYDINIVNILQKNAEFLLEGKKMQLIVVKQSDSLLSKIKGNFFKGIK